MRRIRGAAVDAVPGSAVITELEIDEPRTGEVLVRTVACGVCHSDLSSIDGSVPYFQPPFVLGHEPAGIVEAVGPDVRHLEPGDHIVACLLNYCGHCAACLSGEPMRCAGGGAEANRTPGDPSRLQRDGQPIGQHCGLAGFSEFLLVGKHNVTKIDKALPLEQACLLGCGVLTGTGAVLNTTPVRAGSTVAVIGCGGVGLAAIQGARLAYAGRIIAIDLDDAKLELATSCGATDIVNATDDDPVQAIHGLVPGGVDYAFEAIGRPETVQQGIAMVGMLGVCTVVGIMSPTAEITVGGADLMMGKTVRQSLMGSSRSAVDIPRLAEHALAGRIDLEVLIERTRPLDELPAALDDLAAGRVLGRTVITL